MKIDLHTHSTFSDGTLEPVELVEKASQIGIAHLAFADHDSTGGFVEACAKAKDLNINLIPAIEINTRENTSMHILGYFIDENDNEFQKSLQYHREMRLNRAKNILGKLQRMGIKISLGDLNYGGGNAAIGRPHIADKLKEKGLVFSRQEAFDKFLGEGKPAYVFYEGPTPQEAIQSILASKGIPVIAHPGYHISKETIESLTKNGLQGIEIYCPIHNPQQIQNFLELSRQLDLVVTGGSDYHGPGSGHESLGEMAVPEDTVEKLLQRKLKLFG